MLSEISQTREVENHTVPLICGTETSKEQTETHGHGQRTGAYQRVGGEEGPGEVHRVNGAKRGTGRNGDVDTYEPRCCRVRLKLTGLRGPTSLQTN